RSRSGARCAPPHGERGWGDGGAQGARHAFDPEPELVSAPVLVVHGHFYQPPRENPWTDAVEREPSAAPFHDWNARIHAECYRANGFARIHDGRGRIARIVDNYRRISFDFGPTLMRWIERADPRAYARIVAADREAAAGGEAPSDGRRRRRKTPPPSIGG